MSVMENWTQAAFRYRDDDGSESGATWRVAINTNDTLVTDTNYRMRFCVQGTHTGGSGSFNLTPQFQYNLAAAGWNNITTSSSVCKAVTSGNFTDGDTVTEQLSQSQTFITGYAGMDTTGVTALQSVSDTEEIEVEICFQIVGADVSDGQALEMRVTNGGTALDVYSNTPSITIQKTTAVQPGADSLVIAGKQPSLNFSIIPGNDTVVISGKQPSLLGINNVRRSVALTPMAPDGTIGGVDKQHVAPLYRGIAVTTAGETVTPGADALVISGKQPTVTLQVLATPGIDTLAITGYQPSLDITIPVGADSLVIAGFAPSLDISIPVGADSLVIAGLQPTVTQQVVATPGADALVISGQQPTINQGLNVAPGADALVIAGQQPSLDIGIPVGADSLVIAGFAPSLDIAIPVGADALVIAGQQPQINQGFNIAVGADSLVISGKQPTVTQQIVAQPGADSLVIAGYQASLDTAIPVGADTLAITGYAPSIGITVAVGADALTISGKQPSAVLAMVANPGADSIVIAGQQPTISVATAGNQTVTPSVAALAITGYGPTLSEGLIWNNTTDDSTTWTDTTDASDTWTATSDDATGWTDIGA